MIGLFWMPGCWCFRELSVLVEVTSGGFLSPEGEDMQVFRSLLLCIRAQ